MRQAGSLERIVASHLARWESGEDDRLTGEFAQHLVQLISSQIEERAAQRDQLPGKSPNSGSFGDDPAGCVVGSPRYAAGVGNTEVTEPATRPS